MTIHWNPVEDETDPDSIEYWLPGNTDASSPDGTVDVSGVNGMPDSLGGVAPDAVRNAASDAYQGELDAGNSPSVVSQKGADIRRDMDKFDYERGKP